MKYQNISATKGRAIFARTDVLDGSQVDFRSSVADVSIAGVKTPVVRGFVRLNAPVTVVDPCNACNTGLLGRFVEISFNTTVGDVEFDTLETEVLRLLAIAKAEHMLHGFVPPVSETFTS